MSTGSSGDEDRKLEGGESTVNGSAPSAGAAAAVPSTTTSKADLHPAFYIAYGNDRFILEGGFWLGFGENGRGFFFGFLVFADWVIFVGFGFVCREV